MFNKYKLAIIILTVTFTIILGTVEYVKYLIYQPTEPIPEHLQLKAPPEKISNSQKIKDQDNDDYVSETEAPAKTIKTDNDSNIVIPSEFKTENKNIPLLWTDDNTNENLIIQSDKKYYYGRDSSTVYFSITNISLKEQEPKLRFLFDNEENRGVRSVTQLNNKESLVLANGQSNFYSAEIYYPKDAQGEFFIEAKASNGGYGYLDPYYAGNLVAYWSFNGPDMDWASTTAEAIDASGNSRNGNVAGAKATIGQLWQALEFDGTDDYVDAGNVHDGVKTIAFWIKADGTTDPTYFDGKLDEIYFYSQQLSADQIGRLYRAGARRTIIGNYSNVPSPLSSARPSSKIIDLNGTAKIEVVSGIITANGFTDPTIYINGSATSTIDSDWRFVAITTGTDINASATVLGKVVWTCEDALAYGGQNYTTKQIGDQCWMAENLNTGTMLCEGEGITCATEQNNNSDLEKYCYQNNTDYCAIYGALYQWAEAMDLNYACNADDSCSEQIGSPHQGICPTSWHIPTDDEWKTLEVYLGMCEGEGDGSPWCVDKGGQWRGTDQGSRMADNKTLWTNGALEDDTDFNASKLGVLPAGYRGTDGSFLGLSGYAYIWSSLESGGNAWRRALICSHTGVHRNTDDKLYGFSVRCLKD